MDLDEDVINQIHKNPSLKKNKKGAEYLPSFLLKHL